MMPILFSLGVLALVSPHLGRARVSRSAARMLDIDPNMPTNMADYMRQKANKELGDRLKEGEVIFDANSDWTRTEGEDGKSMMSQNFESTDTPDYVDENDPRSQISFKEGITGSQKVRKDHSHDPGVKKALEVNPEVIAGIQIDGNRRVEFVRPVERWPGDPAAAIAADFDLGRVSKIGTGFEFEVEPACMTFEDYYAGFTADSSPAFVVEPAFGRMDRKGGAPTVLKVYCKPNGAVGPMAATLCVILPDDGEQWTFCFKAEGVSA